MSLSRIETVDDTDIRLDPPPKLAPLVTAQGLTAGIMEFDRQLEEWHQNVQKQLTEKFYTLKK